jgi:hypothetical protein
MNLVTCEICNNFAVYSSHRVHPSGLLMKLISADDSQTSLVFLTLSDTQTTKQNVGLASAI